MPLSSKGDQGENVCGSTIGLGEATATRWVFQVELVHFLSHQTIPLNEKIGGISSKWLVCIFFSELSVAVVVILMAESNIFSAVGVSSTTTTVPLLPCALLLGLHLHVLVFSCVTAC